jgi:hypothetical protein
MAIGASVSSMSTKAAKRGPVKGIRKPEFVEIPIEGKDEKLVGRLRVEGHRIMWGDKETKKWRRVPLDRFIAWINDPALSKSDLVDK